MALADLREHIQGEPDALEELPIDDGYTAPFFDVEDIALWLFPTPPEEAVLYYNPAMLRTAICRERAIADFRARHPALTPKVQPLSLDDLRRFSISRYPLAERAFRQRGYVSNLDFDDRGPGNKNNSQYLVQSKAAVDLQYMVLDYMIAVIEQIDPNVFRMARDEMMEGLAGCRQKAPVPLIENEGLLLGCTNFRRPRHVHMAHEYDGKKALARAEHDDLGLIYAMPNEISDQVAFELTNSADLFNGATPLALATWHSQVLAYLRKWTWTKEFLEARKLENIQAVVQARAINSETQGDLDRWQCVDAALKMFFTERRQQYEESLLQHYDRAGISECDFRLSEHQKRTAMLHGSTYQGVGNPDGGYRKNKLYLFEPLSVWIGDLKRKRCAVLNDVAGLLFALFDEVPEEFEEIDYFANELSLEALKALHDNAALIEENAGPVHVAYEWTRDLRTPRSVDIIDGVLIIRGPLLSFPLYASAHWNEKAEIIGRIHGFELRD